MFTLQAVPSLASHGAGARTGSRAPPGRCRAVSSDRGPAPEARAKLGYGNIVSLDCLTRPQHRYASPIKDNISTAFGMRWPDSGVRNQTYRLCALGDE